MKHKAVLAILLLTSCKASFDDESETFETGASTEAEEVSTAVDDAGSGDGDGLDSSDEESTGSTQGDGDGDISDDSGDGDGDEGGDGDGDESSTSVSTGDGDGGDGDGDGETGSMSFPGDPCDPFNDDCIDGYLCHVDDFISDFPPEFRCREFSPIPGATGEYGSVCSHSPDCQAGLKCVPLPDAPDGACEQVGQGCCVDRCTYEETCSTGATCEVIWWAADLEDYLDGYVGIGACTEP